MDNKVNLPRFSSCRGVSFEIKPTQVSPFAAQAPTPNQFNNNEAFGRWVWLPWTQGGSFKVFPTSGALMKSLSQASSHYCDLEEDDKAEEDANVTTNVTYDVEKQKPIVVEQQQLAKRSASVKPIKKTNQESRLSVMLLNQGLFTVYKRLFAVCLALNLTSLVLAATGHFPYAKHRATLFSMANILALTLCRSEAFLRIVFWLVVKVLAHRWVPLIVKTSTTSFLQSLGGIHSGCRISAATWLIYALVLTLHHKSSYSPEIVGVASTILALLWISCLGAFPLVRHLHHNVFERTHRFAGWTALALLWVYVILTVGYEPSTKSYDNIKGSNLVNKQEFWFLVAITFFTALPWVTVRRVPVAVSAPSGHASIIKFTGGIKAGILGRISRSPLSEWHVFGIMSDDKDSHMMLAGAVGDFTRGLVSNPPSHLWVRQLHFAGLPYLVNMYNRAVLVATGSDICVFLSFLLQPCAVDVCVVWVTKGVEQNFGTVIKEWMSGHPKDKVIVHDTAILGRPNVAEMTIKAARQWKAEVVVVTSNPQGSRDVVRACKAVGIAAFGPIWDS